MDYEFSLGWFLGGIVITVIGGMVVVFYRQIAENLANGVSSYERVKLFGVIMAIAGLILTANLHTFLLGLIVKLLFDR